MRLKLMFITNNCDIALIMQEAGVDRVFVDLEKIDKQQRQGHVNSVKSSHCLGDIAKIKPILTQCQLLVRVNPIYNDSKNEVDEVIKNGADIVMLPMFKTIAEVKDFINFVNGRAKTCLLFETKEAVEMVDEILETVGIDEAYIGLNDLHLSYGKNFMFELLTDGTVETLCDKFKRHNIPYGFGGIASLDEGQLPARVIIAEHYRLGSSCVILSRSFWDSSYDDDLFHTKQYVIENVKSIREFERSLNGADDAFFAENRMASRKIVDSICNEIYNKTFNK